MSGMYLSGVAGTGKKIMKNFDHFSFSYVGSEQREDGILYKFNWRFDNQEGYMSIIVLNSDGRISESSSIGTALEASHSFSRPLGLYNDNSLHEVFEVALKNIVDFKK